MAACILCCLSCDCVVLVDNICLVIKKRGCNIRIQFEEHGPYYFLLPNRYKIQSSTLVNTLLTIFSILVLVQRFHFGHILVYFQAQLKLPMYKININSLYLIIKICRGNEIEEREKIESKRKYRGGKRKKVSSHCSSNSSANVCVLLFIELGQTKVRDLRVKVFVKQHISRFDVSMNNFQR